MKSWTEHFCVSWSRWASVGCTCIKCWWRPKPVSCWLTDAFHHSSKLHNMFLIFHQFLFIFDVVAYSSSTSDWLYRWQVCLRSATERFLSLQRKHGTVCHQKWRLQSSCKHLRLKTHLFRSSFPLLTEKWLQCHRQFLTLNFIVFLYFWRFY